MYDVYERREWKLKPGWRDDFRKESCAYCYFDCPPEICEKNEFFCDNFEPNDEPIFSIDFY